MKYGFAAQDNYRLYECLECEYEETFYKLTNFYDHTPLVWPEKKCPKCGAPFKPGIGKELRKIINDIWKKREQD